MDMRDSRQEQFIHLAWLSRDPRVPGISTSPIVPADGPPPLEIMSVSEIRVRVRVVHHGWGWIFTWRPWWSAPWRRGEWVRAEDEQAAEIITAAVTA